ncbi:hypothetical protein ACOQFV_30630 [Nocardiopsis changdeensis]|uniref:Uncharacterized protein n=1 Tax=Nocardiopsis changdeensis TaxID=2831969 RepID=A0ABX8BSE5_9ACTN|nr:MULTISPECIES: hypothetical protein [Nocardiopsis]QUX24164.1 hypothetical protein KGD84_07635 [Nocardiopsis changdeensis]QYX34559.1 hypothetical protein K1J57_17095 [Nocardiopsis sp. MT53]
MYDKAPEVAISDWFTHARITSGMLRTLDRIGPGGVIIADLYRRDFRATHARTLDPGRMHTYLIVYGHHDLTHDLPAFRRDYGDRFWEELVAAVDCTAFDCMDDQLDDIAATGLVVTRMRQHMHKLGFDLTSVPRYRDHNAAEAGGAVFIRRVVTDRYAYRAAPHITVTVKSPVDERTGGMALVKISDSDRHVTGWPALMRTQFSSGPCAHRVHRAVQAHLARTRA